MNRWYRLGSYVVDALKGITPKYVDESDTIVLNQKCIRNNSIDYNFSRFHDSNKKFSNKKILRIGDILFNSTGQGTAGRCCFVRDLPSDKKVITDSHILILRLEDFYLAQSFSFSFYNEEMFIQTFMDGSTGQGELDKLRLFNVQFRLPKEGKRKSVCDFLSALNEKIEVNNEINQQLEAMAKLVYDYWFVQYDFPIPKDYATSIGKPELAGKPYKSSGGKMVYNAELKREIPEGWKVGSLLDIAVYTNGIACQKYRPDTKDFLPVIKIKEMRDGFTSKTEKVKVSIPKKVKVFDGDVLFSWSASLEVMIWSGGDGGLNQHIFKVTSKKYPKSFYFFELLNYLQYFKMVADLRKTTMGHITRDHLKYSRIGIPPLELINSLDSVLDPILEKQIILNKENQQLAELRDWLLPMLMNGQVRVAKGYDEVEDVVSGPDSYREAAEDGGKYGEG